MKTPTWAALFAASASLFAASPAWALAPTACDPKGQDGGGACFGTELTFTNDDISTEDRKANYSKQYQKKYFTQWRDKLKPICESTREAHGGQVSCRLEKHDTVSKCAMEDRAKADEVIPDKTAFRVCIYGDETLGWTQAWSYEVNVDGGCMELSSKPMNLRWAEAMSAKHIGGTKSIFDKFLFEIASSLHATGKEGDKLQARKVGGGGGHVHIDAESAFGSNPIKMLNFMTDIHNLGMFPLGPSMSTLVLNCPPLSMLWPEQRTAYRSLVADYNTHKSELAHNVAALKALGQKVLSDVYYATYIDRRLDPKKDAALLRDRARIYKSNEYIEKMTPEEVQGLLKGHFGSDRLSDYENENGEGWAHKAHDIRMDLERYGTVELRNIAAEGSTDELLSILGLLHDRAAMTEAANVNPLSAEEGLKLSQPPDDLLKASNSKYYDTHDLTTEEATAIATRFRAYVRGANEEKATARLRLLLAFMPEKVKNRMTLLLNDH